MSQASRSQLQVSQNTNWPQNGGQPQIFRNSGRHSSSHQSAICTFNYVQKYLNLVDGANPFISLKDTEISIPNTPDIIRRVNSSITKHHNHRVS
ncbi:8498_t:CDS:2 [Gigaspora margarita]|uniref:8498_t:CDS:1 n=1 Tax=Gigaspora margarita TaxID=4874 RepID=A0ABN7UST1_GIGMA|nr:8498_t:CDS:2 [Gigaspora margarita]